MESYPINIWDDYYEDDYVPVGEKQETYIYVEDSEIPLEERKKVLEYLLNYINNNLKLEGVKLFLFFYDSKLKYPTLIGTENEWCLFERWEIRVKNLTHERRHKLVEELELAKLSLNNIPFHIYSES